MDYTQEIFIGLLANGIGEKRLNEIDFSKVDSEELIHLSRVNTVSAIVYSAIKDFDDVPNDLSDSLKSEFMRIVMKMSKYSSVLDIIVKNLDESNITYAVAKGKSIAKYYPEEELRDMGDIDILVPIEAYDEAKNLFKSFSYEKEDQVSDDYEFTFVLNGVDIELQKNMAHKKNLSGKVDYAQFFEDLINHRVVDNGISVIDPKYSFIFNIYHTAQHFYYAGCGVRMLLDIAVMIRYFKDTFDWDEIIETLKQLELFEFAINIFSIIDEWFGIRIPSSSYKKKEVSDECKEYFINAGIFGRAINNSDVVNIRKFNQGGGKESFVKWAFPSSEYMRETNEWFKNKPKVLLPVAHVIRISKNLRKRGGLVKGTSVMGRTKQDLEKHKAIVKQMGLE